MTNLTPTKVVDKNGVLTTRNKNLGPKPSKDKRIQNLAPVGFMHPETLPPGLSPIEQTRYGILAASDLFIHDGMVEPQDEPDAWRKKTYVNPRIDPAGEVDIPGVLESLGVAPSAQTPELVAVAIECGIANPNSYYTKRTGGYYGEERSVFLNDNVVNAINAWILTTENVDTPVHRYVRSKGVRTSGMDALNAIKTQLKNENNKAEHAMVDAATEVSVESIKLANIDRPNKKHYDSVEPKDTVANTGKSTDSIYGVVVKDGKRYRLVDGYGRTKGADLAGAKTRRYVVLS